MSSEMTPPTDRAASIEWPTVILLVTIYASWLALTWWHDALPLWLWVPLAAWTAAWWGSAQHEMLHGHPTRSRAVNTALATPPFWLWLPFETYRASHLIHHRDERLTDPLDDPESRYWTRDGFAELGPIGQKLVDLQQTLLGRLVIGPVWSMARLWMEEGRRIAAGDRHRRRLWMRHALWVALLLAWVIAVCDMPLWQYLFGFVYCGTSLALVRSFAEHRARDHVDQRTAIVEKSPLFGLLFLHNNLHVVHHRWPTLPWYKIPAHYAANRAAILRANGGLVYDGYLDVFRRFFLTRHDEPVHPTGRAPAKDGVPSSCHAVPAPSAPAAVVQAGTKYPAATASLSQASVVA
jgi:fatty acid desaturase